jgi:hypothetical protein
MRIFAWRYDSRKNYLIYCTYLLFVSLIIIGSFILLNYIANMKIGIGIYIPNNSKSYKIIFRPVGEKEYYISECDILSERTIEYKLYDDILLTPNNIPICPGEFIMYTFFLAIVAFCWLVYVPLGIILYYDSSQFWKHKKD